jgi:RHS repeat-associated protein
VDGQKLGTYSLALGTQITVTTTQTAVFFGSKRVAVNGAAFVEDRLGSNTQEKYFPYGEDRSTPIANDQVKFATYTRDSVTGLDYADQRYYSNQFARFMSPDRYHSSGGPTDPQSWNRYAYVGNDPINYTDVSGRQRQAPGDGDPCVHDPTDPDDNCAGDDDGVIDTFAPSGNVYVTNFSSDMADDNQKTIRNVLQDILAGLAGDANCSSWLQGTAGFSASDYINVLLQENNFGHGDFNNNGTAAFEGYKNKDGSLAGVPSWAAFTVNNNGAFFKARWDDRTWQIGPRGYMGGTLQAQSFILIHELAHLMNESGGAQGFQHDAGTDAAAIAAGKSNDKLVDKNCGKLIGGLK